MAGGGGRRRRGLAVQIGAAEEVLREQLGAAAQRCSEECACGTAAGGGGVHC